MTIGGSTATVANDATVADDATVGSARIGATDEAFGPGGPAVCRGSVFHRRSIPTRHEFHYPVNYVWLDPDRPETLCDPHPLWSASRPAPVRFRRRDYGLGPMTSIADGIRDELADVLGYRPDGPVRMLTQVRRWGWLFNPITVYAVWSGDPFADGPSDAAGPVGSVLEVTNTPWKERHRYPIRWSDPDPDGWRSASVDKRLHVSPFLDECFRYDARLRAVDARLELEIDVVDRRTPQAPPTIHTSLTVTRQAATRASLGESLWRDGLPTHRVSLGIHAQAARLWRRGVRFVAHPSKRPAGSESTDVRHLATDERAGSSGVVAPIDDLRPGRATDVRRDEHLTSEPEESRARVRTGPLLARAARSGLRSTASGASAAMAGPVIRALLRRMSSERLDIHERIPGRAPAEHRFGPGGQLGASVTVSDPRAYSAVLTEGSIGFGRGFLEGWWTSDDPVAVVRIVIRNMGTLDRLRNRWRAATGWATDGLRRLLPRHTRQRNRDDIGAHYDIGNPFFELFLDETMTYSSAVFPSPESTLADASLHKYDLLLDKLGVDADHHLLEIGTGWGGMAIRAAERGAEVTTTTISNEQLREARKRVANGGYADRVTLLDDDWRDLTGRYDRVVSIEMIEAVDWRDYDAYFATVERSLAPDGLAAIQAITLPDDRWERAKNTEDFIRRFVFPNGFLPSVGAIRDAVGRATDLRVVDVEDLTPHYAETLRRWRDRFDSRVDDVTALGLDDRFQRLWRFYLAYCEAGFRERHCTLHQIVLAGRDRTEPSV